MTIPFTLSKIRMVLSRVSSINNQEQEKNGDKKDEFDQLDCLFCFDPLKSSEQTQVDLQCHHSFHQSCLMRWGRTCAEEVTTFNCPVCRKGIKKMTDNATRKSIPFSFKRKRAVTSWFSRLTGIVVDVGEEEEENPPDAIVIPGGDDLLTIAEFFLEQGPSKPSASTT
ncbi:hypothetical protein PENTCL1PPCAC_27630, partial [Pristionchus entomophagus]